MRAPDRRADALERGTASDVRVDEEPVDVAFGDCSLAYRTAEESRRAGKIAETIQDRLPEGQHRRGPGHTHTRRVRSSAGDLSTEHGRKSGTGVGRFRSRVDSSD